MLQCTSYNVCYFIYHILKNILSTPKKFNGHFYTFLIVNEFSLYACIPLEFSSLECLCPFILTHTHKKLIQLLICLSSTFLCLSTTTFYLLHYLLRKVAKVKKIGSSCLSLWCLEERSCTPHTTFASFISLVCHSQHIQENNLPRKPLLNDSLKSVATVSLLYCPSLLFLRMILLTLFLASFNDIIYLF